MYDRDTMLVKIATMFYEEGQTQTNISKELGISRPTIATLLSEAKEKGIVKVIITHPNKQIMEKQSELQKLFPHTEIHIATLLNGTNDVKSAVGHRTAQLLYDLIEDVNTIGIGWGTTLAEVIKAVNYTNQSHISIYPLIGGVVFSDVQFHANHLSSELANKTNGTANYLYAPAIAETVDIKKSFYKSDMIQTLLESSKQVDLALVGVGNPIVNSNYQQHGFLTPQEIDELKKRRVIGDILTSFFDDKGNIINTEISNRMIGLSIEDLNNIDIVVGVAAGAEKAFSTKIVLERGLLSHLIVDELLANTILSFFDDSGKD